MLFEDLDLSKTVDVLVNAASRAFGSMINKYYYIDGFDYLTYKKLYEALVIPVLSYGAAIWGVKTFPKCETLQHRVMRTFLGACKATPLPVLFYDLQWTPISVICKLEAIKYWHKLCSLPENRLTRKCFMTDKLISSNKQRSWCYQIKTMLTNAGVTTVWEDNNNAELSSRYITDCVKNVLVLNFYNDLSSRMENMSRLTMYKQLDLSNIPSVYCTIRNRHFRSVIVKLRSNTIPVEMELGRYRGIPAENRLCSKCNSNSIEDDTHILFDCSFYLEDREQFINTIFEYDPFLFQLNSREKVIYILNSDNLYILIVLAKFLITILKKRQLF